MLRASAEGHKIGLSQHGPVLLDTESCFSKIVFLIIATASLRRHSIYRLFARRARELWAASIGSSLDLLGVQKTGLRQCRQ
jgi:hypothetical protein